MNRRPSQETLAAFAAGTLDEGLSLVVAAHVAVNPRSAAEYRDLVAIGGAMLEDIEPVEMDSSARDEVLTRIDATPAPLAPTAAVPPEPGLPAVLAPYRLGRWMPIGRGVALRRVEVPGAEARVFMLRAKPGIWLPAHRHTGHEWTTIIDGAYEHQHGRYAAGDFDEADEEHAHTPHVDPELGCTCIVALTGKVVFEGWLGRMLQPLVRL